MRSRGFWQGFPFLRVVRLCHPRKISCVFFLGCPSAGESFSKNMRSRGFWQGFPFLRVVQLCHPRKFFYVFFLGCPIVGGQFSMEVRSPVGSFSWIFCNRWWAVPYGCTATGELFPMEARLFTNYTIKIYECIRDCSAQDWYTNALEIATLNWLQCIGHRSVSFTGKEKPILIPIRA